MTCYELFKFGWLGGIWRARGYSQVKISKIFAGAHREKFQGVDDHVRLAAVRQVELNRHAMRIGVRGPVRNIGYPRRVQKRTVTGNVLPLKMIALLSDAPSGAPLKLPSTTTPLA